jgi:DNA repair protein RadC
MKYPTTRENISLGDMPAEVVQKIKSNRRRVCASRKQKFAWLRFDTCIEIPKQRASTFPISSSKDAVRFLHGSVDFKGRGREYFMVLSVDTKNVPIGVALLGMGGRNSATVDMPVVLQSVLLSGGTAFIIGHNHPSGIVTPSSDDDTLTEKLKAGARSVGLPLLDHVVLSDDEDIYYSYLDRGRMPE